MEFDKEKAWNNIQGRIHKKQQKDKKNNRLLSALIAVLIISGSFSYFWLKQSSSAPQMITVTTVANEIKTIVLADSSRIILNSNTSLTYPKSFEHPIREVHLLSGEASFAISHDATRPFHVWYKESKIEVHGTYFNVNTYSPTVYVTLKEGLISFHHGTFQQMLHPGQRLQFSPSDLKVQIREVNAEQELSWQSGKWVFQEIPLETALSRIALYYGKEFKQSNPTATYPALTLSLDKKTLQLSALLDAIAQVSHSRITLEANQLILH
ncbi:FecR family protein [Sphingobacterium spiritivorum]|uniref:FecR family protein n=1 Tax=Sphingobacterium spiritivorum TaxID=258 RepID=UPI003DA6720B